MVVVAARVRQVTPVARYAAALLTPADKTARPVCRLSSRIDKINTFLLRRVKGFYVHQAP